MFNRTSRLALAALAFQALAVGCVQTRPSRNLVPNEHQYVRKDFLVGDPAATTPDPGWWMTGTITQVSTPNPLGSAAYGLSPGITVGATPMRFVVSEDKLQMVSAREMTPTDAQQQQVTPAVINAWSAQSVDLMYYVNLDGELTNQYVINQEAPWQQREWVQVDFDKNDMSDLAPLGEAQWNVLSHCVDSADISTTLVPGSFLVDETNSYMEFTVSVTMPLIWDDANCVAAYGDLGQQAAAIGKESVTMNVKYSMKRMLPIDQVTYQPLVVAEKDGMHHKYGFFPNITENLDPTTGILASEEQVERFDPNKDIIWYFAKGFDPAYKHFFTDTGTGIADRTNAVLAAAGAKGKVIIREYDDPTGLAPGQGPRLYGDIRYSFLVWMNDQFSQETFAGVTTFNVDYRTGEMMSANIAFNIFAFQDYYVQRINDYLLSVGAADDFNAPGEWPTTPTIGDASLAQYCSTTQAANSCALNLQLPGATSPTTLYCQAGTNLPIQSVVQAAAHNGTSTVFGKMQTYMGRPQGTYGNLGPSDFISRPSTTNDADFFNAYYALIPYITYADPTTNPYVIPEGGNGTFGPPQSSSWTDLQAEVQFQQMAANINAGHTVNATGNGWPYTGASGEPTVLERAAGANQFRALGQAHQDYLYNRAWRTGVGQPHLDGLDSLAFENVADTVARTCGVDTAGQWQTKAQWLNDITQAYWGQVEFHEFGHSMGLQHNFMGSIDAPHFPAVAINGTAQSVCDANPQATGCLTQIHTSSIMEYQTEVDRLSFRNPDWLPYDKGAIAWIFGNNTPNGAPCTTTGCSISGQNSATSPWNDPLGFNTDGTEKKFLFCDEQHEKYTPLCRTGDLGRTPSEIIANELDSYEWQYQWRNLRQYHKFWDDSAYANGPQALFVDLQKFVSLWAFDWSASELTATLKKIGISNPNPATQSDSEYFVQLTDKFNTEASAANQMAAAYHIAMINQATDERPAASVYDPYYGDVTQQGIILDKYFAMQDFTGLWPVTNYDPSQAAGAYLTWYEGIGDSPFTTMAQYGVTTMLGGVINVFPYFQPTAVALFAQDTHDPAFGAPPIRNWIGGHTFYRLVDFQAYFQQLAVAAAYTGQGCQDPATGDAIACNCLTQATCTYDPRNIVDPLKENQFTGPDQKRYIWVYLQDRNVWYVAETDTNIVTNFLMIQYNNDVVFGADDGNFPGGAFGAELPIKYTFDSFNQYN